MDLVVGFGGEFMGFVFARESSGRVGYYRQGWKKLNIFKIKIRFLGFIDKT
jgi:hypothetical protein